MFWGIWITLSLMLSACGDSKPVDPFPRSTLGYTVSLNSLSTTLSNQSLTNPLTDLSYEFSQTDNTQSHGARCNTGKRSFSSSHALCMALIDHPFNQHCANQARFETYQRYCAPLGYRAFDALSCTVALVERPESIGALASTPNACVQQLEQAPLRPLHSFCVGRSTTLASLNSGKTNEEFQIENALLKISTQYTPPNETAGQNSFVKLLLKFDEKSYFYTFSGGKALNFGCADQTLNPNTRLVMYCKPTHGCQNL